MSIGTKTPAGCEVRGGAEAAAADDDDDDDDDNDDDGSGGSGKEIGPRPPELEGADEDKSSPMDGAALAPASSPNPARKASPKPASSGCTATDAEGVSGPETSAPRTRFEDS